MLEVNRVTTPENPACGPTPVIIGGPYLGEWEITSVIGAFPEFTAGGFAGCKLTLRAGRDSSGPSSCVPVKHRFGVDHYLPQNDGRVYFGKGMVSQPHVVDTKVVISFTGKVRGQAEFELTEDGARIVRSTFAHHISQGGAFMTSLTPEQFESAFHPLSKRITRQFTAVR